MTLGGHGEPEGHAGPAWTPAVAIGVLVGAALLLAVLSEILVGSIEPFIDSFGLSAFFVGVVIIPTIGNLAEHLVAVQLAAKDKMEFAMAVTFGSSLQVALFVAPVLVLLGVLIGQPMDLVFTPLEIAAVAAAVGISALIAHRRRDELARGRPADARLRRSWRSPSSSSSARSSRGGDGAEGIAPSPGSCGDQAAAPRRRLLGSARRHRRRRPCRDRTPASAIGSVAGASPRASAWAASESAACCAS